VDSADGPQLRAYLLSKLDDRRNVVEPTSGHIAAPDILSPSGGVKKRVDSSNGPKLRPDLLSAFDNGRDDVGPSGLVITSIDRLLTGKVD